MTAPPPKNGIRRIATTHPVDMAAAAVLTVLAALAASLEWWLPLRAVLGGLLVALLPGLALAVLLFPERELSLRFQKLRRGRPDEEATPRALPWYELGGIAIVLSLAITALVTLGLVALAWGSTPLGALEWWLAGVTLLLCSGGAVARYRLAPDRRPVFDLLPASLGRAPTRTDVAMQSLIALSLVALVAVVVALPAGDRPGEYHGFYMLGAGGDDRCYPELYRDAGYIPRAGQATCSSLGTVTFGIVNHEGEAHTYTVYGFWTQNSTQAGQPRSASSVAPAFVWSQEVGHTKEPTGASTLDRSFEKSLVLPKPPFIGRQTFHARLIEDLDGPVESADAADELVLQVERLADTPPPPEPTAFPAP